MRLRPSSAFLSRLTVIVGLVLASTTASAWGPAGHSLVNQVAVELMNSDLAQLFKDNTENLRRLANVPDVLWKQPATYQKERFAHFFQWDQYQNSSIASGMPLPLQQALDLVGKDYIIENGTAVWRGDQLYRMLVSAIRAKDWVHALQYAGVMGHYFGDLSQPMHITSDYDGQSINQRGIHAYFESTLIDRQNSNTLHGNVWRAARQATTEFDSDTNVPQYSVDMDVIEMATKESIQSYSHLASVLADFSSGSPNDQALVKKAVVSLAEGAVILSRVWDKAVQEAFSGGQVPSGTKNVADPNWIPVEIAPAGL